MEIIEGLNPQQQQAVTADGGAVLVLAGPGSGKTRVLTHRIAYLIEQMGVKPYHILAVTFTNKASQEMQNRVVELLGDRAKGVSLGTFHATCARLLRREAENLPFDSNFVIYDSDDQLNLVKRALEDLEIDVKSYRPASIHTSISNAKNALILPDDYPVQTYRDEVVNRVYRRYQELILASNALDFDDLLLWTVYLFNEYPAVREKYARRFVHVLVDEFQDTNQAQYVLLKHMAAFHHNVFVVGDVDQSIYRWRGADYHNVLRFERDFPHAQVIFLEQNYRSTQSILDVAKAVIDHNPYRTSKGLFTERGQGEKVMLIETHDDREEASCVVDTISGLVARNLARPGDFAVMYRTNAQSRLLEEAFLRANLPYKLVGAQRFYGRREVKDLVSYLRLVHNPDDEVSLLRVINIPPRGIGNKTIAALQAYARQHNISLGDLLLELGSENQSSNHQNLPGRVKAAASAFGASLTAWRKFAEEFSPLKLLDSILDDVGYHAYIDDATDEGRDRWENVGELRRLAADYEDGGLVDFLEHIALISDQDTLDPSAKVPTLLTLHAAKGLEFPIVFIIGLNDGILPHIRSLDDQEAMHEERRLFYVGITRAKDRLYLLDPLNRRAFGYTEPTLESRFLNDIPLGLLEARTLDGSLRHSRSGSRYQAHSWDQFAVAKPRLVQNQYPPGCRVQHPIWGDGMVLISHLQDDDEIVEIFFEGIGLKRVLASLANLEVKRES